MDSMVPGYSVCLSVPYPTRWGQSVRAVMDDELVAQGSPLECQHVGSTLVWTAQLAWPASSQYSYRYVVVNESGTVEDQETRPRTVQLPEGLAPGAMLHITDEWQDTSDSENILATSAFQSVIFANRSKRKLGESEAAEPSSPEANQCLVRLLVWEWSLSEGQAVHVTGSIAALGNHVLGDAARMTRVSNSHWQLEVVVTASSFPISYNYLVEAADGAVTLEDCERRNLQKPSGILRTPPPPSSGASPQLSAEAVRGEVPGCVSAMTPPPQPPPDRAFSSGSGVETASLRLPPMGTLSIKDSVSRGAPGTSWSVPVTPVSSQQQSSHFGKAGLMASGEGSVLQALPQLLIQNDGPLQRKERWRGSGVAVPVFSLRTQSSLGVGEFLDIKLLVDVCCMAGMRLIQLLPVNDTSVNMMWWDSYPYSSLSVHALHPLYLALRGLTDDMPQQLQDQIDSATQALTSAEVDYDGTMAAKMMIARSLFDSRGAALLQTDSFKEWYQGAKDWLQPYAAFCFLRDLHGSAEHWKWGSLSHPSQQDLDRITAPQRDFHASIQFVYYVQYHLHCQLLEASQYAASRRVVLKGDLPIGVDKRSVDAWMQPSNFRMDVSTGAPPDVFAKMGQNWGFPTYDWNQMEKDGYTFWRRRLTHMSQYFHAYRIDHVLGFFRIWEIPGDCVTGMLGHFRPSIPIRRFELESHGIWDIDRICDPYVTWPLLQEEFGDLAADVASKYFEENHATHRYSFRPAFSSESGIAAIKARPESPGWLEEEVSRTRSGLMRLRQNVVLLRNQDEPDSFYPRFQMADCSSWKELVVGWRDRLLSLHDDYFYRRQEELWRDNALRTLPTLMRATDMMVCGEDLGMIPSCVHPVMDRLGLLGLRIQRMPSEVAQEFGRPAGYPYAVVCSPSCHDTSTTRAWWEEDEGRRTRFAATNLPSHMEVSALCTPEIMRSIVRQHLASPAMWCILPIQDMVALSPKYVGRSAAEETINDPTNPRHYWRYRTHYTLEDLLADEPLLADLQALLLGSGRCNTEDLPELHTQ